jgi:hypothetical protein
LASLLVKGTDVAIISIPLHSNKYPGLFTLVDEADYELANAYRWHRLSSGWTEYAISRSAARSTIYLHRLIAEPAPGYVVDHIDGNGLNNTRDNLRVCTHAENCRNSRHRKRNTSGYRGVTHHIPSDQWIAYITTDMRREYLGYYPTAEDAARAYDVVALRLHGDFARLNFKPPQT